MRFKFAALLAIAMLLLFAACAQKPETKEVVREVEKEVPVNLWETAEKIRSGEIDVGEEYGMELGKRWHNIHAEVLGLKCSYCHISGYADDFLYQRRYKLPVRDAPGVVDRAICLGCHKQNGPARELYMNAGVEGAVNP
ncbi:hypothetical protein [Candidatus Pyrohabitans sp.]